MERLVDVYRATYVGVGAHPRLLFHAVEECASYVERIYDIVRILFPQLPQPNSNILIVSEEMEHDLNVERLVKRNYFPSGRQCLAVLANEFFSVHLTTTPPR
jgi:hypothetical protein